jgi:hypothetical protein
MNRSLAVTGAIAISVAACGSQPTDTTARRTGSETSSVTVTLPAGDVKSGRQAFDLKIAVCHAVASEPDLPPPVSAHPDRSAGIYAFREIVVMRRGVN